ncbi:MAG: hypothetical protein ACXIUV_14400 [Alkalilacustris sp.]
MCENLPGWSLAFAALLVVGQFVHLLRLNSYFHNGLLLRPFRKSKRVSEMHQQVVQRCEHYAALNCGKGFYKDADTRQPRDRADMPPCVPLMSDPGHLILLGILKKIEAKNAALATIAAVVVAFLGFFLTGLMADSIPSWPGMPPAIFLALAFGLILTTPLFQLFVGNRHIDQKDFSRITEDANCDLAIRARMQRDLIDDLLNKERAFAFARVWIPLILLLALLFLPLLALYCLP